VIDYVEALFVEGGGKGAFGNGHAHGTGNALTQRPGGDFHPRSQAVFGVARSFGMNLPELFQVGKAEVVARQVQQPVKQHGGMAV
jgi:hypothetical protein